MAPRADAATLNVQPRKRRTVYTHLANAPDGRSFKHLLEEVDMSEPELRETLRKLDAAGLVRRTRAVWTAVPLEPPQETERTADEPASDDQVVS